jgi:UDP-2-acetamido-3-amino-2,3-dideoxy-glucuronate N-acetyltransferase
VRADVKPYAIMVGVPAIQAGWMCQCGERLPFVEGAGACGACGTAYRAEHGMLHRV